MKLIKNPKWENIAKNSFEFSKEVNLKTEAIIVDYAINDKNDQLIIYGFDLPDDSIKVLDIVSYLCAEKQEKPDSSIMHKLFAFYDYGDNPVPFLVTKNKLFYLPNGIRQINFNYWKETDRIDELIKIKTEINNRSEKKEQQSILIANEEKKQIRIQELKNKISNNQFVALTKKPFWFEDIKYEVVPTLMLNGRNQTKRTTNKITRMCILEKSIGNRIKLKVTYDHNIYFDGGGVDPEEYTSYDSTYYFIISDSGQIEEHNSVQSKDEAYCMINFENQL